MKAVQIVELTGPRTALRINDVPEPEPSHPLTPGEGVVVDVHAAGVSFPEVLQTRGEYQVKPDTPFTPGSEVGGVVRSAPASANVKAGDRVAAFCLQAGGPRSRSRRRSSTFKLPDALDFAQGAGLVLNYHTAYFSLVTRGRLHRGRDRARARRRRRRRHRDPPDREGPRRHDDRGRLHRRQGARGAGGRRRPRRPQRRPLEGRGEGDLRRRGRHRDRPGRRRPVHRQPALAARGRPRGRGRVHRRVDPRGPGQPAAAGQHRGDRRRLGQLRDPQAEAQPGDRRRRSSA